MSGDGYAAVDALVALTILSATVIFALVALHTARRAADAALEARQSTQLLRDVLERAPPEPGVTRASDARFSWQVTVHDPVLASGPAAMCRQDAVVTAVRTGRKYTLTSARICPAGEAP